MALGLIETRHIPATLQLADIFTKSLSKGPYYDLRSKLGVGVFPTSSLRGNVSVDNKEADKDLSSAHDINIEATKPTSRQRSYGEKKKCTMMTVPIHNQFDTLLSLPEGQDGFTAV